MPWREGLARLADLAAPPGCVLCGEYLTPPESGQFCEACLAQFHDPRALQRCPRCAAASPAIQLSAASEARCRYCRGQSLDFDCALALGSYSDRLRAAILRTKRWSADALTRALGALMAETLLAPLTAWQIDVVVPVAMHWRRRIMHGANGAAVLARPVAARLQVPCAAYLLKRLRATQRQGELGPRERWRNVRSAFVARRQPGLAGARVLLIDDVLTTGATASSAASALRTAGAAFVGVAVVARSQGQPARGSK